MSSLIRKNSAWLVSVVACLQLISLSDCQHLESIPHKTDPITLDLYHRIGSQKEFKPRGSILVRPKTEFRPASASLYNQVELSDQDLDALLEASKSDDIYHLKVAQRRKKNAQESVIKKTSTIVKSCSIISAELSDIITVNLSPSNEFISVNLRTSNQACSSVSEVTDIPRKFNTTVLVESSSIGPIPDTATYIKRLEEERLNKLKEGKEDNRSFFAKYWVYIVPAVIILMVFSGPGDQGGR